MATQIVTVKQLTYMFTRWKKVLIVRDIDGLFITSVRVFVTDTEWDDMEAMQDILKSHINQGLFAIGFNAYDTDEKLITSSEI